MRKIRIGIFGFGKTGKYVVNEFIKEESFSLLWVVRKSHTDSHKYASRLLGYEFDEGRIYSIDEINYMFFKNNFVDMIVDFSSTKAVHHYADAAKAGTRIISAISKYEKDDLAKLKSLSSSTSVLYSPNITLGINFLMIASQILKKIAPHADIEIIEEHFRNKPEVSGTAKKIAQKLGLDEIKHVNSIRVGGIVGRHEVVFGLPNQTIRLTHESISRAAFGQGAIFAAKWLVSRPKGMYSMENIISEMVKKNAPVY